MRMKTSASRVGRRLEHDQLVAAHAQPAVGDGAAARWRQVERRRARVEHDEIVAQPVHLEERRLAATAMRRYMAVRPGQRNERAPDLAGMGPAQFAHVERRQLLGVDGQVQDAERLVGHGRLDEQPALGVPGRRCVMDRPVAAAGQRLVGKALVVDQHVQRHLIGHVGRALQRLAEQIAAQPCQCGASALSAKTPALISG